MNHLERHEVLAVLKIAREQSELDWLLFTFQYIHSHRISEVLALTPENFDGGYCTVQRLVPCGRLSPLSLMKSRC
jgi:integrase